MTMKTPAQITDEVMNGEGRFNFGPAEDVVIHMIREAIEADRAQRTEEGSIGPTARGPRGVEVVMYRSERDGATVVQIDTREDTGRLRVYLNDGPQIWDADPEKED